MARRRVVLERYLYKSSRFIGLRVLWVTLSGYDNKARG
jgi:hypothetical protein